MANSLLPSLADNAYRGRKTALWLFALLLATKAAMSLSAIFDGYAVASRADGIPLDTFAPPSARTVVALFALLGFCQLVMAALGLVVLARYRALVPLLFALFLLEHVGRKLILTVLPVERTGTPPGSAVSLVLLVVMAGGLALSLWRRDSPRASE